MEISVKYLPLASIALMAATIIVTVSNESEDLWLYRVSHGEGALDELEIPKALEILSLSLSLGHIRGSLPYIRDTGTEIPESYIFGQALNIFWILWTIVVYVKYRQVKDILNRYKLEERKVLNRTTMQTGLIAAFGISVVANFQETNQFYIHWFGVVLALGLGAVHHFMQTILYMNLSKILEQKRFTLLRFVLAVLSLLAFLIFFICGISAYMQKNDGGYLNWRDNDGGFTLHNVSVIFEWISALCTMLYIALYHWEFKKITLYEPDVFVEDNVTINLSMERTNEAFEDV